ncbi:carbon-nitrogen hydrolase family protein [Roseivirga sp.]|uniref:carbon-nitrogen hydrolase family protein n=1 Tax=Roseivirga sp. TaxID=1964215 RepID=UPI002B267D46|nr:carbon-nitrogen hydrolase family protein [Roseivirga sp.]
MKICVAQTKPIPGNIDINIHQHLKIIDLGVSQGVKLIVFPELSLTGYEPSLAKSLAIEKEDVRLEVFQNISDKKNIAIGVGVPMKTAKGITISMLIFQPNQPIQVYSKGYLHADEVPYFQAGDNSLSLKIENYKIALAICYEISIPEHSENAFKCGAEIYITSVAKFRSGVNKAKAELANIASIYSMNVLMANCIGMSDGGECAGETAIWNKDGDMISELDDINEGLLILDTTTQTTSICFSS